MIELNYKNGRIELPILNSDTLCSAGEGELKLLLLLATDPELCEKYGEDEFFEHLCSILDVTRGEINAYIAFWRGSGVITVKGKSRAKKQTTASNVFVTPEKDVSDPIEDNKNGSEIQENAAVTDGKKETKTSDSKKKKAILPENKMGKSVIYTMSERNNLMEADPSSILVIDELQSLIGKTFNSADFDSAIWLMDQFGLDGEYIVTLCEYLIKVSKRVSMTVILNKAQALVKEDVDTCEKLIRWIESCEYKKTVEHDLRRLLGEHDRSLTASEKSVIAKLDEYGYSTDILSHVYETTVNNIQKPNPVYMLKIIENYHANGLHTLDEILNYERENSEQIKKANESKMQTKSGKVPSPKVKNTPSGSSSFDTDAFFEAALQKSMADSADKN